MCSEFHQGKGDHFKGVDKGFIDAACDFFEYVQLVINEDEEKGGEHRFGLLFNRIFGTELIDFCQRSKYQRKIYF